MSYPAKGNDRMLPYWKYEGNKIRRWWAKLTLTPFLLFSADPFSDSSERGRPEVGAGCLNWARPDLCGGRVVTCVPTAIPFGGPGDPFFLRFRPIAFHGRKTGMAMKGMRRLSIIRTTAIVVSIAAFEIVLRSVVDVEIYRQIKFAFIRIDGIILIFSVLMYKHFSDKLDNTDDFWKMAVREFKLKQANNFEIFVYLLAIIVWILTGCLIGGAVTVIIDWK